MTDSTTRPPRTPDECCLGVGGSWGCSIHGHDNRRMLAEAAAPDAGLRGRIVGIVRERFGYNADADSLLDSLLAALAAHRSSEPSSAPPKVKRTPSGFRFIEDGAAPAGSAVDVDRLAEVLEEMQAPMAAGMAYLALPIPEHDWNPSDPTERIHDARAVAERIAAGLTRPDPTGDPYA